MSHLHDGVRARVLARRKRAYLPALALRIRAGRLTELMFSDGKDV